MIAYADRDERHGDRLTYCKDRDDTHEHRSITSHTTRTPRLVAGGGVVAAQDGIVVGIVPGALLRAGEDLVGHSSIMHGDGGGLGRPSPWLVYGSPKKIKVNCY